MTRRALLRGAALGAAGLGAMAVAGCGDYGASLGPGGARWYIVGGNTADGPSAETWAYDLGTAAWSPVAVSGEAPPPRYSADAAFARGKLYIFGGHDGTSEIGDMWTLAGVS